MCFFLVFNYLGTFSKIELPCRRQLENQGPGVTGMTLVLGYWKIVGVFWEAVFQRNYATFVKNWLPKETPIGAQAGLGRGKTQSFHPWVIKVAQVMPKGAQSCSKAGKRVPK